VPRHIYDKFPAECNSERISKNVPNSLKYPAEYIAYFFGPPCVFPAESCQHLKDIVHRVDQRVDLDSSTDVGLVFPRTSYFKFAIRHRLSALKNNINNF